MMRSSSCYFIHSLFGFNSPAVPVSGSQEALLELNEAVGLEGLCIQPQAGAAPNDIVRLAYQHLQSRGQFPSDEELKGLLRMSRGDRLAIGIDVSAVCSHTVTAQPPFQTLDVATVVNVLRVVGIYQQQQSINGHPVPQNLAYQLGILSMTMGGTAPCFQADLFPAQRDAQHMRTIWLYRWCMNGDEHWRAIGAGAESHANLFNADAIAPQLEQPGGTKRRHSASEETDRTHNHQATTSKRRRRLARPDVSNLTFEEILDGRAGPLRPRADLVAGEVILHVARHWSNTEILEKVNAALLKDGQTPIPTLNNVTRRITVAISSVASKGERTVQEIRDQLKDARKANGVIERMKVYTREKKATNLARAQKSPIANEDASGSLEYPGTDEDGSVRRSA